MSSFTDVPSPDVSLNTNYFIGSFHKNVTLKNDQNEIVFDRLRYPLSILLLVAIGAKIIGPHGLQSIEKSLLK